MISRQEVEWTPGSAVGAPTAPGTIAYLTVQHELHIAHSVKGDPKFRHHPLVRKHLANQPTGHLVRGGERHAELVVLSDVLHEYDRRQAANERPALAIEAAQELLGTAQLDVIRTREPGDPFGGIVERPCASCLTALIHFGVLPWSELAFTEQWRPAPQPVPDPHRFPAQVADALVDAGWRPSRTDSATASDIIDRVCAVAGRHHRHEVFPAAERTLRSFPGLICGRRGPGEQVWISRFEIDPVAVAHTADTLAAFAAIIGVRLFPIGTEGGESILAVDEYGRIFALDQAGEWFLGANIDEALTNLLVGRAPARVRDDGSW
ncbi:SUKH-3 domain-containing protein [Micromonospora sp. NPDC003197]